MYAFMTTQISQISTLPRSPKAGFLIGLIACAYWNSPENDGNHDAGNEAGSTSADGDADQTALGTAGSNKA